MNRVVDRLFALPIASQFLLLALCGVPLLPAILAYGLWLDHWPVAKSGHPAFDDLSNLWLGAKAALGGDYTSLFQRDLHEAMVAREFGAPLTNQVWSYPPTMMLVLLPLGLLPSYAWFASIWMLTGGVLFAVALFHSDTLNAQGDADPNWDRRLLVLAAAVLVPGSMLCVNAGQTGMLTSAILFFGLLFAPSRPVLAGAIIALLVAKPHLGLSVPVVLLALCAYRAIAWAAAFASLYLALTVVVLGVEPWQLFLSVTLPEHMRYVETVAAGPDESLKMTVFMLLRTLGLSKAGAMSLHVVMSVAVLAALATTVRHEPNHNLRFLAVALAALLISPYLLGYELVLAALALGRVVLDPDAVRRLSAGTVLAFCGLLSIGHLASIFYFASLGVNPMAALILGAFVWMTRKPVWQAVRHMRADARATPKTA